MQKENPMAEAATSRRFRMSDYVKDGYLAEHLRNEMIELRGEQLAQAQEAIIEVATSGVPGTFEELLGTYRRAIRRTLQPERKLVKNPQIDRKLVKNPTLAAALDRELRDVTVEELAAANAAVKEILDQARDLSIKGGLGEERLVTHRPSDICHLSREHSTLPNGDTPGCGYFRDPGEWLEVFQKAVRAALAN
jgi:hypothetical protein